MVLVDRLRRFLGGYAETVLGEYADKVIVRSCLTDWDGAYLLHHGVFVK